MLKGISMAAKAMKNQTTRNDAIANNLANAATTGFKKDVALFRETRGNVPSGSKDIEPDLALATIFETGPLSRTDRPLDLAIQGDGFFVVETDDGERYTRSGAFTLDAAGYLTTADGMRVVSSAGSLQLPSGAIDVSSEGLVSVDGSEIGRVRVVRFSDPAKLEKAGGSLFKAGEGIDPEDVPPEEASVLAGFLEQSNVEAVTEMTDMIAALKAYEVAQKALKSEDEVLQLLTNTVGRVGTTA